MKLFLNIAILSLFINTCEAQDFDLKWAKNIGNIGDNYGFEIQTDNDGNTFISGTFRGSLNFGDLVLTCNGTADIFIAKYNKLGQLEWANQAGGETSWYEGGYSMVIDSSGNCYLTGDFKGTAIFNDETLYSYNDSFDAFLCKYNKHGNLEWVNQIGGDDDDKGVEIEFDSFGNVTFLVGSQSESIIFDENITINGFSNGGMYISKYTESGDCLWAKLIIKNAFFGDFGFEKDDLDNIYISGTFPFSSTFGEEELLSLGFRDIFLAKYDDSGNLIWVKQAGGKAVDYCNSLSMSKSGHFYITGHFTDTAYFDDIQIINSNITEDIYSSTSDIYVAKYDTSGNIKWVRTAGDNDIDESYDIGLSSNEDVFIVGRFQDSLKFGNSTIHSNGNYDVFISRLDSSGKHISSNAYGGNSNSFFSDRCWSVNIDNNDLVSMTGNFHGTMNLGTTSLTSIGQHDIYIIKWTLTSLDSINEPPIDIISDIVIYPNPTDAELNIKFSKIHNNVKVTITNLNGKIIQDKSFEHKDHIKLEFDIPPGIYFISIINDNNRQETFKFIKK